jgi:hypothetical protein
VAPCTATAPCSSFDRAYRLAMPSQTVLIAGGSYPGQAIWPDPGKAGPGRVVFRPAIGATVSLTGSLHVYGSHVEFRALVFGSGWYVRERAANVVFLETRTRTFSIGSATSVRVLGGEVGPMTATSDTDPKIAKSSAASWAAPTDVLIDGVSFHDIGRVPGSGLHIECLQVGSAIQLIVRNSRFENCATHSLLLSSWGSSYPLRDILIENNVFGAVPQGYHSAKISVRAGSAPCERCVVRGNVATKPVAVDVSTPGSTIAIVGNSMPSADLWAPGWCDHGLFGVLWDSNRFSFAPTCGSNASIG